MKSVKKAVFGFPEGLAQAKELAQELKTGWGSIEVHTFPDGESKITLPFRAEEAVLYRSLYQPNPKIFEVIQALSALRDHGAKRVLFVCPYLPYMRQDKVFHEGEDLSQKTFSQVITPWVDGLISVEPHLHRQNSMESIFPGIKGLALSGGKIMAGYFAKKPLDKRTLVLGPDEEAWHTAKPFAEALSLDWATALKKRSGDRAVQINLEATVKDRPVLIVDDVISTGMTVIKTSKKAFDLGASSVEVASVHALFDQKTEKAFKDAGISRVVSCDGVPHPTNAIPLAPALADALKGL